MEILRISGGNSLQGEVEAAGAKNAMTKLLVASLLSDKRCIFHNVPNIGDVELTVDLCREIGMEIQWDQEAKTMEVITRHLSSSYVPQRFSGSNRIPILMIGALLGRTKQDIIVPTVGGCKLGSRPVDFHVEALRKLGALIEYREMKHEGAYFAQAHEGLKGTVIELPYPSVGATENTMLAAVTAEGYTLIKNAAIEPEVIDLVLFLQKLGAHISIDVDRKIHIHGTTKFFEVEHTVLPDRLEVASFGMAAIATKGRVFVKGARHDNLITFLNRVREVGGGFTVRDEGIEFYYESSLRGGLHIETNVYPGFCTDWQQPFVVLLTQAKGTSIIHETVYENRFGYTKALREMGADVSLFKECLGSNTCRFGAERHFHSLVVKGSTPLTGGNISIPDLRAGFAYVMAALISKETSTLEGVSYLDRGYEDIVGKLQGLGADISRETAEKSKCSQVSNANILDSLKENLLHSLSS